MLLPPCFLAHRLATSRPDKNSHFLCIPAWEKPRKKAISAWSGRNFKCRAPSHRGCFCVYCQPVCVVKFWLAVSYRARSGLSMFVHRHRQVTGTPTVHREMWIDAAKWYAFRAILDASSSGCRMSIVHRVMFSCPLINVSLCIYQCFLVHLSMSPCAFINAFLPTYQCFIIPLSSLFQVFSSLLLC